MDPLSITVGTVSLTASVIKIAITIRDLAEEYQDAPTTINQVVGDVEIINTLLLEVKEMLSRDSDMSSSLDMGAGFSRAVLDCQATLMCINGEYEQLQNRHDVKTKLLVLWKDVKMKALLDRLESQKGTLGVYISMYIGQKQLRETEQIKNYLMQNQQVPLATANDVSNLLPQYPATHKVLRSLDGESAMIILSDQDSIQPPDEPSWIAELAGSKVYSRAYMQQLHEKQISSKESAPESGPEYAAATLTIRSKYQAAEAPNERPKDGEFDASQPKDSCNSDASTPERHSSDRLYKSTEKPSNEAQYTEVNSNRTPASDHASYKERGYGIATSSTKSRVKSQNITTLSTRSTNAELEDPYSVTTYAPSGEIKSLPVRLVSDTTRWEWGFVVRTPDSAEDIKNFTWDHGTELFWPDDHFCYYDRVHERFRDGDKAYLAIGAEMPAKLDKSGAKRRVKIRKDAPTGLTSHIRSLLWRNDSASRVAARVINVPYGFPRHEPYLELRNMLALMGRKIDIGNVRLLKGACYRYEAALEYILVQLRFCSSTYFLPTGWKVRCLDDAIAICLQDLVYCHMPTADVRQMLGMEN